MELGLKQNKKFLQDCLWSQMMLISEIKSKWYKQNSLDIAWNL